MRWLSIVLLVVVFSSCRSLKPTTLHKNNYQPITRATTPDFIENITIFPSNTGSVTLTADNNTVMANTFDDAAVASASFNPLFFKYAILLDVPVETLNNVKLFNFIDDWYGTPYRFGGNNRDGIDCSAFAASLLDTVYDMNLPRMAKEQFKACVHVKKEMLTEGDLVFFHTTRKGISHVGVYLGHGRFVHASLNYGVTVSDLTDGYYARTFRGGGRVRLADSVKRN